MTARKGIGTAIAMAFAMGFGMPLGAQTYDPTGALAVSSPLYQTTGTLAALNDAVTVALLGRAGAGVFVTTANLNASVVAEASYDGGATWAPAAFIQADGTSSSVLVFAGLAATQSQGLVFTGGVTHVRIRISSYTSGTATGTVRATGSPGNLFRATGSSSSSTTTVTTTTVAAATLQPQAVRIRNTPFQPVPMLVMNPAPLTTERQAAAVAVPDYVGTAQLLSVAGDTAYVTARGMNSVGVTILPGPFDGVVIPECSMDGGVSWTATYFDQANTSKVSALVLQSPTAPTQSTIVAMGGCSSYRVRVLQNNSGGVVAQLRATMNVDPSVLFAGPNGSRAVPPANAVVAGIGADGAIHAQAVDPAGVQLVRAPGLPLPLCNAVRKTGCRPF